MVPVVMAHGGAGVAAEHSDGCVAACRAAMEALRGGADAVAAAVAGVHVLEDDVRYNAGRGSAVRLDGRTIQQDAGIADATGFGSVAGLTSIRHPVDVALAVRRSPHVMLQGEGAQAFARRMGMVEESMETAARVKMARDAWPRLREDPRWANADVESLWNYDGPMPPELPRRTGDTVGMVVRDGEGNFCAAGSTGGTSFSLRGRVGDTPIFGAGFYCSVRGAVVATGIGEEIWRRMSARVVHDAITGGTAPMQAAREHCASFAPAWDVGILVVGPAGWGAASNRPMAWAAMEGTDVVGRGG